MNELSRRDAIKVFSAGAAVLSTGAAASALTSSPHPASADPASPSFLAAKLFPVSIPENNPIEQATVLHCRSWDSMVYLHVNSSLKGFVQLSPQGFALAAAAQAQGRPVAIRYWGHDPEWNSVGLFRGALLALDARDLPGHSDLL